MSREGFLLVGAGAAVFAVFAASALALAVRTILAAILRAACGFCLVAAAAHDLLVGVGGRTGNGGGHQTGSNREATEEFK